MKDQEEVQEMLDKVLALYDKEASKSGPTSSTYALRQALEWVLCEVSDEDMEEFLEG